MILRTRHFVYEQTDFGFAIMFKDFATGRILKDGENGVHKFYSN